MELISEKIRLLSQPSGLFMHHKVVNNDTDFLSYVIALQFSHASVDMFVLS